MKEGYNDNSLEHGADKCHRIEKEVWSDLECWFYRHIDETSDEKFYILNEAPLITCFSLC